MPRSSAASRHMGLIEPCLFDSDERLAHQLLDVDDPTLADVTPERLRRDGWVRLGYAQPFVPLATGFPRPGVALLMNPMFANKPDLLAYDAAYVVLAQALGAELWTLDGPFARTRAALGSR